MNRSCRFAGLSYALMLVGAVSGCSTMTAQQFDANESFVSPNVNPEARAILVANAMSQHRHAVALGAGDRFGNEMYTDFIAFVRAQNGLAPLYATGSSGEIERMRD